MKIILDCDDVLANTRDPIAQLISELKNQYVHPDHWSHWGAITDNYDLTFDELAHHIIHKQILETSQPEDNAHNISQILNFMGHDVVVLTARGYHKNAQQLTEEWCQKHRIKVSDVVVVDHKQSKAQLIKTFGDVFMYVDDNPHHILEAASIGHIQYPILKTMPWNNKLDYNHRIDNLSSILPYF